MRKFLILLTLVLSLDFYSQGGGDIVNNTSNTIDVTYEFRDTAGCTSNGGATIRVAPNLTISPGLPGANLGEYLAYVIITDVTTSASITLYHGLGYCYSGNMSDNLLGFQWGGLAIWNYAPGSGPPNKPFDLTFLP